MTAAPSQRTTSLKLDTETRERVRRLAEARRHSSHWVIREAVAQYLAREEQREQLRQDALAAWAEYQATGLHATAEETDAWLARLEAGEDADPPACHP
jgi:predicted transcriptional regulator